MKQIVLLSFYILMGSFALGQETETDPVSQEAISLISFIEGKWEGDGWIMGRDGQREVFRQTENVQLKLDGTAILIEGLGKTDGQISHNALAIITFNREKSCYNFQSYLSSGLGGSFKAELIGPDLYWYPNESIRYIIKINEKGQWFETGEMKRGEKWFQFFEMTLDKQIDH